MLKREEARSRTQTRNAEAIDQTTDRTLGRGPLCSDVKQEGGDDQYDVAKREIARRRREWREEEEEEKDEEKEGIMLC